MIRQAASLPCWNCVGIDLIRKGTWIFPEAIRNVLREAEACYRICVYRAALRGEHEVYPIGFRARLPAIRVPLRPSDDDVVLDLQHLIDQCHERGRYHLLDYRSDPFISAVCSIAIGLGLENPPAGE